MLKKLRIRFLCVTMVIVLGMLCVIFGLVLSFTSRSLEQESIRMMQSIGSGPGHLPRPGERQEAVYLPYFSLQFGPHGELLAAGGSNFDLSDQEYLLSVAAAAQGQEGQIGVLDEYNLRFYKSTGPGPKSLVFADLSAEQATMRGLARNCLLIGLLSLAVFFVVGLIVARWAVKPVEQAWQKQRQFVADASHELKTPLTVILTNAELLQESTADPVQLENSAASILTMSRKMRGLVEGLLELARVDNGSIRTSMETVDLSGLVSDGLLPFEPLFFERQLELLQQVQKDIVVRGSESHLRQVLDILLDNAMKYTHPGGKVQVLLKRQGAHGLLTVSNTGEPIPQAELKLIFERFYRVEKARGMSGSYGLGLSIAQQIVEEHRGRIWAESREGTNRFFVQLPVLSIRKETEK
ncbi:MAG: HAMP domain-containing histidine kinase [Clostridia bacterium]|nr:HAMP domain-containing histidine kinase [Clostridia bacterium]